VKGRAQFNGGFTVFNSSERSERAVKYIHSHTHIAKLGSSA
jgi:hypothetical protein